MAVQPVQYVMAEWCVCVLLLLVGIGHAEVSRLTADELLSSVTWKDLSRTFLILAEADYPPEYLSTLGQQLSGTPTVLVQVSCSGAGGDSELCLLLSSHPAAVRKKRKVRGVALNDGGSPLQFTSTALEALLGDLVTHVQSYNDYRQYVASHPPHLLTLTSSTTSQEYISLLTALLATPVPLVVTMATEVLPLSHRPSHTLTPPPLYLWFVSGNQWARYSPAGNDLVSFLQRTNYPMSVEYVDPSILAVFSGSGLSVAYFFSGVGEEEKEMLVTQLVTPLLKAYYQHFAFVVVGREKRMEVAKQLHLQHMVKSSSNPFVVVKTPDEALHTIDFPELSGHLSSELEQVSSVFHQIVHKQPPSGSQDGHMINEADPPPLSHTDPSSLALLAREGRVNMLATFCKLEESKCLSGDVNLLPEVSAFDKELGTRECPDRYYGKLEKVMRTLKHIDKTAAFVVQSESVEDILQFQVTSLPSVAFYDRQEKMWRGGSGGESTVSDYIQFAMQGKLQDGMSLDDVQQGDSHDTVPPPSDFPSADYFSPQLKEDDHFGSLLRTFPPPSSITELHLTDKTLASHVAAYSRTAVVFYMKWCVKSRVFLHHVMAAVEKLDPALNCSLALVSCDGYPDVCTQYNISTYPYVLLFHNSTLSPLPLTGTLDSAHLLSALGQHTPLHQHQAVPELRADTLPILLRGDLSSILVVWCGEQEEMEETFMSAANSQQFHDLTFAWMDSEKYSHLLESIVKDITFPSILAMDFRQHRVYMIGLPVQEHSLHHFLSQLIQGILQPTGFLPRRSWPPLQPPIQFPSDQYREHDFHPQDPPLASDISDDISSSHHPPHSHTEL